MHLGDPEKLGPEGLGSETETGRGERRHIVTNLNYYLDPGDGSLPAPVIVGGSGTVTNERAVASHEVTVSDITGEESCYTLDSHGFQFLHHESVEKEFCDKSKLKTLYFPEMECLLKDVTGAPRVVMFDHKVRRGPANWHRLGIHNTAKRGPLHRVHVDQSYAGAEVVLQRKCPDEADDLLKRRFQIINVWRPIKTITRDPLAVADANSIDEDDLVPAATFYPDRRSETWTVKPNNRHRWYFKNEQGPDEVLLIKCFDSRQNVARRTPHCAFRDPEEHGEARQSVEVRALVLYDSK